MKLPSNSPITLAYGATSDPYSPTNPHRGTDFSYVPDNTIYAPFSGKVTLVPNNGRDGNGLYMYHPNGDFHGMLHSSKYLIADGSQVQEGQPIGIMGQTGYAFGVHLHWCVKRDGVFIDPMSLITKGEAMDIATFEDAQQLSQTVLLRPVPMSQEEWDKYHAAANRTFRQLVHDWASSDEAKAARFKCWDYNKLASQNGQAVDKQTALAYVEAHLA